MHFSIREYNAYYGTYINYKHDSVIKTFYETIKQDLEEIGDKMKNAEVSKHYLLRKYMLQICIENKNKYNLYSITH